MKPNSGDALQKRKYNFDLGPLTRGFRFYWVPLLLLLAPVLYLIGYWLPLFPSEPVLKLGEEALLASSFSGYALGLRYMGSRIAFGFFVFSLVLLVLSALLLSFYPYCRSVKLSNIVFGVPWLVFSLSNAALLLTIAKGLDAENLLYYEKAETPRPEGLSPFASAGVTYWILLIIPFAILLWWWAVNLCNLKYQKKKGLTEISSESSGPGEGEEKPNQSEAHLVLGQKEEAQDPKGQKEEKGSK